MKRRVFLWSIPDGEKEIIAKRIRYMLENGWAGEGWSEINVASIKDLEEFRKKMKYVYNANVKVNKDGTANKATKEGQLWGYLREDVRIKAGDIIILKSGFTPYAIGVAESECEYREEAKALDIANGVRVKWVVHNNGGSISFPVKLEGFRGVIKWVDNKKIIETANKIIQEALNAQKFRGDN